MKQNYPNIIFEEYTKLLEITGQYDEQLTMDDYVQMREDLNSNGIVLTDLELKNILKELDFTLPF